MRYYILLPTDYKKTVMMSWDENKKNAIFMIEIATLRMSNHFVLNEQAAKCTRGTMGSAA